MWRSTMTNIYTGISDNKDLNHESALNFIKKLNGKYKLITTNYVLDETYTLLLMNTGYQTTIAFKQRIDIMIASQVLEIVWIDEAIANRAWQIFAKFNVDKEWSFTDCTSYAVMKQLNIAEAFTLDPHFAQMSFVKQP